MKYIGASPKFSDLSFQDFTDTIAWSGSSRAWIQCQQKSACGKSTHNNFNCSTYHPRSHGVS